MLFCWSGTTAFSLSFRGDYFLFAFTIHFAFFRGNVYHFEWELSNRVLRFKNLFYVIVCMYVHWKLRESLWGWGIHWDDTKW